MTIDVPGALGALGALDALDALDADNPRASGTPGAPGAASYVVGIDLGTSNSALAYAEIEETRRVGRPMIRELAIHQLIAPGDVQQRPLLPSAVYEPAGFELAQEQAVLPWREGNENKLPNIVGEAAKRLGAKTPVRLIESAKSWLCHGGVNRTAAILPWHAPEGVPKLSPVDVSAAYLEHLRNAWNHEIAQGRPELQLEHQHVVVTVPASFDEIARQLTLDAAKKAGLSDVTLIEEPMAAFYAFVARTGGTRRTTGLEPGHRVLVADVGGGTTDFTLIEVRSGADARAKNEADKEETLLTFERTAVGDHLLLGGDNMDLALAHGLEGEISQGKKLDAEAWAQLKLEARLAKETLFSHPDVDSLPIVITGRGTKLIGGTMRTQMTRKRLLESILEGYFPPLPPGEAARPQKSQRAAGFSEYGLPYATDPAITRHLAAFLLRHANQDEPFARIDALLFNGGALKPILIRDRISQVIGDWMRATSAASGASAPSAASAASTTSGTSANSETSAASATSVPSGREIPNPRPLIYDEGEDALELAVARGAAYYGLVREGLGIRVGGGSPREYFLEVALEEGESLPENHVHVLCIAPRGMQDGQRIDVSDRELTLITNRPVQFPLYATTSPRRDPVGSIVTLSRDEVTKLPPLQTVVKFGKQKAGTPVPVRIQVKRTELGTLEISCLSKMSGARFKLEFDLRAQETGDLALEAPHATNTTNTTNTTNATTAHTVGDTDDVQGTHPHPTHPIKSSGLFADPFGGAGIRPPPEQGDVEPERIDAAKERIEKTFAAESPRLDPDQLMKGLEEDLALGRDAWSLPILRLFAEQLLELVDRRAMSPEIETRWMNIAGFCLRPGFGVPLDDWRVRQLWKIHAQGVLHPAHDPAELNWWILWRRVAGGLTRGHQEDLASRAFPLIIPALAKRAKKKPPRPQTQQAAEVWRAAASLEQLGAKSRAQLGDALVELIEEKKAPKAAFWCLGRIGARKLLYGPREAVVRASTAADWAKRIMALKKPSKEESPVPCLISLARLTGDRQIDFDDETRNEVARFLRELGVPDQHLVPLTEVVEVDRATELQAFGEGLPVGLRLA